MHFRKISGREIGLGNATYMIAEMSANHGHSFDKAMELVHAAQEAGADAL
jgi:sialic acid synthase SpsE